MECVERCADFYGESRPRYSYIDVCVLPWSPPEPGTFLRIAEPPQGALPPWGPVESGPDRPRAFDLCMPRLRETEEDEAPDGLGASESCLARPAWQPPSTPKPACLVHPEPSVYGSPLAVARPDYRGKPSQKLGDCGCKCHVISGSRVQESPRRQVELAAEVALEPPQVQLLDEGARGPGACMLPAILYAGAAEAMGPRRDRASASGSCARVVIPPAHPMLSDGCVQAVLAPAQAAASGFAPVRGTAAHSAVHQETHAAEPSFTLGPSTPLLPDGAAVLSAIAPGSDAEEPLRSDVRAATGRPARRATVQGTAVDTSRQVPGGRGVPG
jgi:hypothetical protein